MLGDGKTKAKTKAEKIRIKRGRGRPKLEGIYRQPNGQPSRAKNPPQKVAVEARARLMGLNIEQAQDQKAATNIGKLCILGSINPADGITTKQYDAIQMYYKVVNDYKRSLLSEGAYYESAVLSANDNEADYEKWCERAKDRFNNMNKAISEGARENRLSNFDMVIKVCIERDIIMSKYLGDLRILCNVLDHHFNPQIEEKNKKRSGWIPLAGI